MVQFDIVACVDKNNGLGKDNTIPWMKSEYGKEDMNYFRSLTTQTIYEKKKNIVIMGFNTFRSLSYKALVNRFNIVISKTNTCNYDNIHYEESLDNALKYCLVHKEEYNRIFVIGGKKLYDIALKHPCCRNIYLTRLLDDIDYKCDVFFNMNKSCKLINQYQNMYNLYETYENTNQGEINYLNLLNTILLNGNNKDSRSGDVISMFSSSLTYNIEEYFPLLTTKQVPLRLIFEELMFFIRGETNNKILKDKKVTIWNGNTTQKFIDDNNLPYKEDDMGPMYGFQWRHFGEKYIDCNTEYNGYDQLKQVIEQIQSRSKKEARRIMMTSFNPIDARNSVLYPCHGNTIQFNVREDKYLDCNMYQRSADMFLGLPFNIASYALFVYIIANITNLSPGKLTIMLGDHHIYSEHIGVVKKQIERIPYQFPKLTINKQLSLDNVNTLVFSDIKLVDYIHHDKLEAKMAV